jgi:hypothetical protein
MIKGTNLLWKDNPGNATEAIKVQVVGSSPPWGPAAPRPGRRPADRAGAVADALRTACASLARWLASMPRRAGTRLFVRNDEEAPWRGWQITELHNGLARGYRDARFDVLHLIRDIDDSGQAPCVCPLDGDR